RALIRMLREAGALEVHVRISSPPVKWPCFYGIDFASRAELIANGLDVDGVRASINADSLGYVSLDGLVAATTLPKPSLCRACFDGVYPIELPIGERLGRNPLEPDDSADIHTDVDGLHIVTASVGAADALTRP
ncbi:MAG: amidophosphoribosyltransferase, partial [Actinomycetes bacterium]